MAAITKITTTRLGRFALFFDDEFLFSVDEMTFALHKLEIGKTLTPDEIQELRCESGYEYAKSKALSLLGYKDYTKDMLYKRLLTYEIDETSAMEATLRMEELGLIDETDYAMRLSRDMVNLKSYSAKGVAMELRSRGIDAETIEFALAQFSDEDFEQNIARVLRKKYIRDLQSQKGKARAVNGLARLGYSAGEVLRVISALAENDHL